jgi:hypothetical protein
MGDCADIGRLGRKSAGSTAAQSEAAGRSAGRGPRAPLREGRPSSRPARHSKRRQDLAFQQAMTRAVGAGLEKPPMIGVYRDARALDAPRLFAPVPHFSGCTSPARMCADLAARDE